MKGTFKKIIMLALSLMVFVPHSAYAESKLETVNNLGMGAVGINIAEYQIDKDGKEADYEDFKTILPGQKISKISRITNTGEPAWIRCKLEFVSETELEALDESMITLASDKWIKRGDYYYWPKAVPTGEHVDFTESVLFPKEWTEKVANTEFQIIISADAVQERNFTPDFLAEDPWFGTMIEMTMYEKSRVIPTEDKAFEVVFRNGTEGLFANTEDFFANWSTMMPGDVFEDTLHIKNSYSTPIELYFSTETIADDILIKQIGLEIRDGSDKVIYSGTLHGALAEMKLIWLNPGDETNLKYKVTVPKELTNKYAMMDTKTKWIFRAVIYPKYQSCQDVGYPEGYEWNEEKKACLPTKGTRTGVEGNNIIIPAVVTGSGLLLLIGLLASGKKKKKA